MTKGRSYITSPYLANEDSPWNIRNDKELFAELSWCQGFHKKKKKEKNILFKILWCFISWTVVKISYGDSQFHFWVCRLNFSNVTNIVPVANDKPDRKLKIKWIATPPWSSYKRFKKVKKEKCNWKIDSLKSSASSTAEAINDKELVELIGRGNVDVKLWREDYKRSKEDLYSGKPQLLRIKIWIKRMRESKD